MRPVLPLLAASVVLLSGCAADPADQGAAGASSAPSASVSSPAAPSAAPTAAPDIEGLEVLAEDPSHDHVAGPIDYERIPPLGGEHNARWLACDVYDEQVPVEFAVHSLEHGAVWLAYDPALGDDEVAALAALAETNEEYVLVSPQEGLDSRVVAVTWGAGLEASSADDPRLAQFVEAYAGGGQGGEKGAPCRGGGVTPREARGQLGTAA